MRLALLCSTVGLLSLVPLISSCTPGIGPSPTTLQSTVDSLATEVSSQSTQIADEMGFISYLATRLPPARPSPAITPRPTPFVTGTLFINDGKCCIGGVAGQAILIPVTFQAVSPAAEVTEMRARVGPAPFTESDLSDKEWEPFSPRRAFEYMPPLNWSGFYVTVQYRDALGNTSPVYSRDISVEGMPAGPVTPTP